MSGNETTAERVERFPLQRPHCDRCAASLEDALGKVNGVRGVRVDVGAGTVQIRYDAAAHVREQHN